MELERLDLSCWRSKTKGILDASLAVQQMLTLCVETGKVLEVEISISG